MTPTVRESLNRPIFRVTSLRKEFVQCYSVLAFGLALGLFLGFMLWHR